MNLVDSHVVLHAYEGVDPAFVGRRLLCKHVEILEGDKLQIVVRELKDDTGVSPSWGESWAGTRIPRSQEAGAYRIVPIEALSMYAISYNKEAARGYGWQFNEKYVPYDRHGICTYTDGRRDVNVYHSSDDRYTLDEAIAFAHGRLAV